jgi:glucan-binding YG repeat protein
MQLYDGLTDINGETYYYVDGIKTYAGLIQIDGAYYYISSSCKTVKGRSYYVSKNNGLKPAGTYTFDETGKMVE